MLHTDEWHQEGQIRLGAGRRNWRERKPTGLARYHYLVPSDHSFILYSYLLFYCCIAQHEKEAILDKDEVEVEGDKD